MEFSVGDFLLSYQPLLPDILHKSQLVPNDYANSTQMQIQKVEEIGDGNLNFVYRVQFALFCREIHKGELPNCYAMIAYG